MSKQDDPKTAAEGRALRVLGDWREVDLKAILARRSGDKRAEAAANKDETKARNQLREAADNLRRRTTDVRGEP